MLVSRHKNLEPDITALLTSRPGNRLRLVSVESPRPGVKSSHRLITLRCRCGAERQASWHRLMQRKYPVFACEECTAFIGYENPQTPRAAIDPAMAQRFIRLVLEVY